MADMTEAVAARIAEIKAHQAAEQAKYPNATGIVWQDWAIEARARCDVEGHPLIADSRCVRCRVHVEPERIARQAAAASPKSEHQSEPCQLYTRDQGCTLHGETCAPEYR